MKKGSWLWILWSAFSVFKTSIAQTENISISEGNTQIFECQTTLKVSWFGPPLIGLSEQTRYTNEGESNVLGNVPHKDRLIVDVPPDAASTLQIIFVLKSDSGTYNCSRNGFQGSFVLQVNDPDATMIVTKGSEVVMPCPHSSTINNIRWRGPPNNTVYNHPGSTTLNDRDLSPELQARLYIDGTSGALKMSDTRLTDENYYKCDNTTTKSVTKLIVLATPEPPNFMNKLENRNGSDHLVVRTNENEQLILVCQVNNGKPRPVVRWFKGRTDWKEITGSDVNTSNTDGTVNVTSTVSLTANRSEDRVTYICQANHSTWMSARNASVQLYLYLKPSVPVMSNPGEIQENASLFVTCNVYGCRPSAIIMWTGAVSQPSTAYTEDRATDTLNISSTFSKTVTRQDNGAKLRCEVTHIALSSSLVALRNLTVWYPPTNISISNNKQVTSGDELTLRCTTGVSNPAAVITWKNGTLSISGGPNVDQDGEYGGRIRHQNITIICDRYMDGIVITCTAYNDRISSDEVTAFTVLDVRYNPIVTVLNGSVTTATEGDINVKFICAARSKPKSNFTWKTGNNVLRPPTFQAENQDTFLIASVSRTHRGEYTCTADNGINPPGWATLFLYVKYPPDINISASNVTIKDLNTTLLCSPYGYPDMYSFGVWLHTWPGVNKTLRSLNSSTTDKTAKLVLHNLTYEDSGIYTCQASNGIKAIQSSQEIMTDSVYLLVKSAPKVLDISPVFGGGTRQDVMVQFNFYSNTGDDLAVTAKHINSSDLSHQGIIKPIHLDNLPVQHVMVPATGFRASVSIRITDTEDFGEYTITVRNIFGSDSRSINIKPASEPDKPNNFTSFNVGKHQVTFSWIPGFHGGFNQTFVIEFSLDNKTWHSEPGIDGGQRKDQFNFTVTGLSPNARYFFRISAYNIIGNGTYADNLLIVDTLEGAAEDPHKMADSNVAAIGGGVGAAVVVITGIAVVLIIMKRRSHSREGLSEEDLRSEHREQKRPKSGLVDNPVYDSSDPVATQSSCNNGAGATYAVVVKHKKKAAQTEDISKLYAHVDTSTKKGRKGISKGKNVKVSKEDIYENAGLGLKSSNPENVYKNYGDVASDKNVYEDPRAAMSNDPQVSKDGFLYADLMLDAPTTKNGKPVIRGIENRTEYAEIAYNKRGEPLPNSDEEGENVTK